MHRAPLLFSIPLAVWLSACSHTPPLSVPVTTGSTATGAAAAGRATTADSGGVTDGSAKAGGGIAAVPPALSYRPPSSAQPPRQLADGSQLPAVQGLLNAADRALRSGDMDMAAVNLERAQRLAPQSAAVYQRFAEVRLRQKRPAEAEQLARKALAYAAAPTQQAQLWRQIAAARRQQGQMAQAQEAVQRAVVLEAAGAAP